MKIKDKKLQRIAKIAVPLLKKNGVVKAGIFDSYAGGEAKKRGDIDKNNMKKDSLAFIKQIRGILETETKEKYK